MILIINTFLKLFTIFEPSRNSWDVFLRVSELIISCLVEHLAFVVPIFLLIYFRDSTLFANSGYIKYWRKLYFSIAFPEFFKVIAIILQIFCSEVSLLILFGILLILIQCQSLQIFTNVQSSMLSVRIFLFVIVAACFKLLIRLICCENWHDTVSLGVIM